MATNTRMELQGQIDTVHKELQYYYNRIGLTPEEKLTVTQLEFMLKNLEAVIKML